MKYKTPLITGACIAAVALCSSVTAFGASKKKDASPSPSASASPAASAAMSPAAKSARAIPFRGTVSSVDASANTFTITGKTNSRVFKVTDKTTVTKEGAAATFTDITAETKVTGSYWKEEGGTLECKSVKIGGNMDAAGSTSGKKSKKKGASADADSMGAAASASPSASPSPKK